MVDKQTKINTWNEYLEKLFEDHRKEHFDIKETLSGPKILQEEVQTAIVELKDTKASDPYNIQSELLKLFDERTITFITQVFNNIYDTGNISFKVWICCYSKENQTQEVWRVSHSKSYETPLKSIPRGSPQENI